MTVIHFLGEWEWAALPFVGWCRPGQAPLKSLHVAPQEVLGWDLPLGWNGVFQRTASWRGWPPARVEDSLRQPSECQQGDWLGSDSGCHVCVCDARRLLFAAPRFSGKNGRVECLMNRFLNQHILQRYAQEKKREREINPQGRKEFATDRLQKALKT